MDPNMLNRMYICCAIISALMISGCDDTSATSNNSKPAPGKPTQASNDVAGQVKKPETPTPTPTPPPPANAGPATGPRWEIAEEIYDFGRIWTGKTIIHPFTIKNVGTEPLLLTKPKAHCSCSSPDAYPEAIQPGQTGQIMYRLNLTNKAGDVLEWLDAQTNDPTRPLLRVQMKGFARTVCELEVIEDLAATEGRMPQDRMQRFALLRGDFDRVTENERLHRVIRMRNSSGVPIDLKMRPVTRASVQDTTGVTRIVPPMFDATFKEVTPGEIYELTVVGLPPYQSGYSGAAIEFDTGLPDYPVYTVNAHLYCPPRVEITPSKMVFNEMATARVRRITIRNNGQTPLEVTNVACTDPNFSVTLLPQTQGNSNVYEIEVIFPSEQTYLPPTYGEIIQIDTTDVEKKQIDIYILPHLYNPPTARPADKPIVFHPGKNLLRP